MANVMQVIVFLFDRGFLLQSHSRLAPAKEKVHGRWRRLNESQDVYSFNHVERGHRDTGAARHDDALGSAAVSEALRQAGTS